MNPHPAILETERLVLVRSNPSHVPALLDLWTDSEVTRYMGGARERSSLRAALDESARDAPDGAYDLHPLVEKGSGRVVGHCGLTEKEVEGRNEVELVYVLAKSVWGRGYATEIAGAIKTYALETLGLRRLIALVEPDNAASERVAVKIGMRFEREVTRPGGAVRRLYAVEA